MQTERHITFSILIKEHRSLIFKILNRYLHDQDYHDDLFQEIALKAWQSFDHYSYKSKFSVWLGQIAKFTVIDKLRRLKAAANRAAMYNAFYEFTYSENDEPYEERSISIIDSLSETEKRTLQYRIDGLTFAQISELTGEPINRLIIRMHRLKDKLRKAIK